ncbi:hypothetical protein [Priestia flexa]|uniref:hypothetical protein n=1 Tax=Priestia flexa TaxID=86664 RepID=UPI00099BCBAD|nr:hypothetical protein [Priestia flexa]AQX56626.1 hypothetical protein BC359_20685 [Priestia flexa]
MSLNAKYLISPKVHRSLYQYSIKRFLEDTIEDLPSKIEKYEVNMNDELNYSRLLDKLIVKGDIDNKRVDEFLLNDLNYGRMKNVYISFIYDVTGLKDEKNVIRYVKLLRNKGYLNADAVSSSPFIGNLRRGTPLGEEELTYFDIEKNNSGEVNNIRLLLSKGINDNAGTEYNNYIGVEINLEYSMLVIKIRNWENNSEQNYGIDTLHKRIQDDVKNVFHLSIPLATATTQQLVYNMVNELSGKVLNQAIEKVDENLQTVVDKQVKEWSEIILSEDVIIPPSDLDVIKKSILHNYYRIYMQNEIGVLKVGQLKEKFGVDGYPRYVKFVDDTIGEGRAKSADPKESLLDTSIFYDIKARLDHAKNIRMATVYWIDSPGYDYLGTTFYTDHQERFKFVVLANFFNKEICDYVLRQINKYRPTL